MDVNITFSRRLLASVRQDVRYYAPGTKVMKDAWVWCAGGDLWEFHKHTGFRWHGRAHNAYEARAKGWMAWLKTCREVAEQMDLVRDGCRFTVQSKFR